MDKLEPPKSLILTGNLAENWRRFKQQFEIYQIASGLDKKDGKVQAMALLHVVGIEALEVYNTFQWDTEGDNVKVDKIMEKFERHCNPRKNLTFERHLFFSRNQQEGETIDAFVTELRIPVLGLLSCIEMNLIQRVHNIESSTDTKENAEELLKEYEHLFDGIGTLPGEYKIEIEDHASPTVHPPRRIPHMLKDKVKDELKRMEKMGVITKVEQPTKWVNPMVVVKKPNGDVRICLDPVDLNKVIQREHCPLKTVEEVAANLGNVKIFTTLDATSGFYQTKLAEESTWLTTFNTLFGRYKFERLPFGIVSAPEVFQRNLAQTFEDIEGCEVIVDDLLVWGKDEEEHNQRLKKVLERAAEVDLRFNKEKCKCNKKEVKYVGHTFGSDGLRPNPDRIQAILDMRVPKDRDTVV